MGEGWRQLGLMIVVAIVFVQSLPYLIPIAFLVFTVCKRRFGTSAILWLVALEAISIWLSLWLPRWLAEYLPSG